MSKVTKARKRRPAKSPEELKRRCEERKRRREERNASVPRLLYTREQTGAALSISVSSVIRLEDDGRPRKVRLRGKTGRYSTRSKTSRRWHRQVEG